MPTLVTISKDTTHQPSPTLSGDRIELLDALRGFALFGVLMVNLRYFSLFEFLPEDASSVLPTASWDKIIAIAMTVFIDTKAITLFTLLFGIGFAMQTERATAAGSDIRWYVQRQLILLVIGFVHAYMFWWGDILRFYAILGLILIPFRRMKTRTLVYTGVFFVVALAALLKPVIRILLPHIASYSEMSAVAFKGFSGSDMIAILHTNIAYANWEIVSSWSLGFFILGRLMIGAALWRSGMLQNISANLLFWKRLFCITVSVGLGLTLFVLLRDNGVLDAWSSWYKNDTARTIILILRRAGSLSLGIAYMAGFVLLFQQPNWYRWLNVLSPLGRMALTNYLTQTVVAISVFYGIGIGVGPRFGLSGVVVMTISLFAVQIVISHWWLARFRSGPAEWCWRSLTYGCFQPMRRSVGLLRTAA